MNAEIGRREIYWQSGFHQETNDNGRIFVYFADFRNMVIGSTMFQHKNIHKTTWRLPDGQ
jgi:hypothetical protein